MVCQKVIRTVHEMPVDQNDLGQLTEKGPVTKVTLRNRPFSKLLEAKIIWVKSADPYPDPYHDRFLWIGYHKPASTGYKC